MSFQVGDKVIHWTQGLGEIIAIDEKIIHGQPTRCYVVRTPDLSIWIPINDLQQNSLRLPTPAGEFDGLFAILSGPTENLLEDRVQRKDALMAQMQDGQLASICRVVRDLNNFKRSTRLNDREKTILERAKDSLLTEWTYSLGLSMNQAQQDMLTLLDG